jgi:hypothetical protein
MLKYNQVEAKFLSDVKVTSWKYSLSVIIETEEQLLELVKLDKRFEY